MAEWDLGVIVRSGRLKLNLSQEELGKQVGVSKDGISRFERGRASLSLDHGTRLAQVLKLPVRAFLQRLADARGERALLGEMLRNVEPAEQQEAQEPPLDLRQPEDATAGEEDELSRSQPDDDLLNPIQPVARARRRSARAIERRIDLRGLRVTVRLSLAQPASLEIQVVPASER